MEVVVHDIDIMYDSQKRQYRDCVVQTIMKTEKQQVQWKRYRLDYY